MKVIFTDTIPGVATRGEMKNIKRGFYRNFLLPRGKAVPATNQLMKEWDERRKKILIVKEELRAKLEETKRRLAGGGLKIEKKVTAKGTLYGGVKPSDIAKALKDQLKLEVAETSIMLDTHIKTVGKYEIRINLGDGVETSLPVEVSEKNDVH